MAPDGTGAVFEELDGTGWDRGCFEELDGTRWHWMGHHLTSFHLTRFKSLCTAVDTICRQLTPLISLHPARVGGSDAVELKGAQFLGEVCECSRVQVRRHYLRRLGKSPWVSMCEDEEEDKAVASRSSEWSHSLKKTMQAPQCFALWSVERNPMQGSSHGVQGRCNGTQ